MKTPSRARRTAVAAFALASAASLLAACGTGGGAGSDKKITLTFASSLPSTLYPSTAYSEWAKKVTDATDGRVKFENNFAGAAMPYDDIPKAVGDGVVDMGHGSPSSTPDYFKLTGIDSIPGRTTDLGADLHAHEQAYQDNERYRKELDDAHLVPILIQPITAQVVVSKKQINSLADFKGMRIRATGPQIPAMKALGATTVQLATTEIYEALQRGVIDAATSLTLSGAAGQSIGEVAKYVYDVGLTPQGALMVWMNKDVYDGLPQDVRDAMTKASEEVTAGWIDLVKTTGANACKQLATQGTKTVAWSDTEKATLHEKVFPPIQADYIKSIDDGQSFWDDWTKLLADYDGTYGDFDGSDMSLCNE